MLFPHGNIHKYTCTTPDEKTDNYIIHILMHKKWHSIVLDAQSVRGITVIRVTLVVAKIKEKLVINKQSAQ
jgi:hypothetical protein